MTTSQPVQESYFNHHSFDESNQRKDQQVKQETQFFLSENVIFRNIYIQVQYPVSKVVFQACVLDGFETGSKNLENNYILLGDSQQDSN